MSNSEHSLEKSPISQAEDTFEGSRDRPDPPPPEPVREDSNEPVEVSPKPIELIEPSESLREQKQALKHAREPSHSVEEEPETKRRKEDYEGKYDNKTEVPQFKPPVMPFKVYVQTLDDFVGEGDAVTSYHSYKSDLNKKHIHDFFEAHKDEEWLKEKYHPDFTDRVEDFMQKSIKIRLDAFLDLFEKGYVDGQSVQIDNQKNIKKLFDAVMLKLSGGSDNQLSLLCDKDLLKNNEEEPEEENDLIKEEQARIEELFANETICFRNLPSCVCKADLEEECRRKEGFLRFAMSPPAYEKRLTRTAWATYKIGVPIKKYCWELNSCPLVRNKLYNISKDLIVAVHRGNHQRVLPISSISMHKNVMQADLKFAATMVAKLDDKYGLWAQGHCENLDQDDEIEASTAQEIPWMSGTFTSNPLMKSANEYIKPSEEASDIPDDESIELEFDSNMARVLDLLIFYLRIVHSFDFYSVSSFSDEENMPHNCSSIHARGDRSIRYENSQPFMNFKYKEMIDYSSQFKKRIEEVIDQEFNTEEEPLYNELGPRDQEEAKKSFIDVNIVKKISKKKPFKVVWMCPFSDKKFREPIYVEKHILNKHSDKVEAILKEVTFFNNYLRDPKRPTVPDAPRHAIEQAFSKELSGRPKYSKNSLNNSSPRLGNHNGRFSNRNSDKNHQQALAAVSSVAASINSHNPSEILQKALHMMNNGGGGGQQRHFHHHNNNNNRSFQQRRGGGGRDFNNRYAGPPGGNGGKDRRMVSYNDLDTPNDN